MRTQRHINLVGMFLVLAGCLVIGGCSTLSSGKKYTLAMVGPERHLVEPKRLDKMPQPVAPALLGIGDNGTTVTAFGMKLNGGYLRYLEAVERPEVVIFVQVRIADPNDSEGKLVWEKVCLHTEDQSKYMALNKDTFLPLVDIPILPPIRYEGQDITVSIRIIELDQEDNRQAVQLVSAAAAAGAQFRPDVAGTISLFQAALAFLIKSNPDDIEFQFDFAIAEENGPVSYCNLSGGETAGQSATDSQVGKYDLVLQPRIGQYAIIKTEHRERFNYPSRCVDVPHTVLRYALAYALKIATLNAVNLIADWREEEPNARQDAYWAMFDNPFGAGSPQGLSWPGTLNVPHHVVRWILAYGLKLGSLDGLNIMSNRPNNCPETKRDRYLKMFGYPFGIDHEATVPPKFDANGLLVGMTDRYFRVAGNELETIPCGAPAGGGASYGTPSSTDTLKVQRGSNLKLGKGSILRVKDDKKMKIRSGSNLKIESGRLVTTKNGQGVPTTELFRDQAYLLFSLYPCDPGTAQDLKTWKQQVGIAEKIKGIRTTGLTGEEFDREFEPVKTAMLDFAKEQRLKRELEKRLDVTTATIERKAILDEWTLAKMGWSGFQLLVPVPPRLDPTTTTQSVWVYSKPSGTETAPTDILAFQTSDGKAPFEIPGITSQSLEPTGRLWKIPVQVPSKIDSSVEIRVVDKGNPARQRTFPFTVKESGKVTEPTFTPSPQPAPMPAAPSAKEKIQSGFQMVPFQSALEPAGTTQTVSVYYRPAADERPPERIQAYLTRANGTPDEVASNTITTSRQPDTTWSIPIANLAEDDFPLRLLVADAGNSDRQGLFEFPHPHTSFDLAFEQVLQVSDTSQTLLVCQRFTTDEAPPKDIKAYLKRAGGSCEELKAPMVIPAECRSRVLWKILLPPLEKDDFPLCLAVTVPGDRSTARLFEFRNGVWTEPRTKATRKE